MNKKLHFSIVILSCFVLLLLTFGYSVAAPKKNNPTETTVTYCLYDLNQEDYFHIVMKTFDNQTFSVAGYANIKADDGMPYHIPLSGGAAQTIDDAIGISFDGYTHSQGWGYKFFGRITIWPTQNASGTFNHLMRVDQLGMEEMRYRWESLEPGVCRQYP